MHSEQQNWHKAGPSLSRVPVPSAFTELKIRATAPRQLAEGRCWREPAAFQSSWGNLTSSMWEPLADQIHKGPGVRLRFSYFFIFFIVSLLENVVRRCMTSASGADDHCFLSKSQWLALEKSRGR